MTRLDTRRSALSDPIPSLASPAFTSRKAQIRTAAGYVLIGHRVRPLAACHTCVTDEVGARMTAKTSCRARDTLSAVQDGFRRGGQGQSSAGAPQAGLQSFTLGRVLTLSVTLGPTLTPAPRLTDQIGAALQECRESFFTRAEIWCLWDTEAATKASPYMRRKVAAALGRELV